MLESFGARLRRQREDQGIALVTIAQQTKIKLSLLEGLERDDVSHWPSGIFRRAYIRAYAQAIGLDPDLVVREFLAVHPEPAGVFAAALENAIAADGARMNNGSAARLRNIFDSALGSLSRLRRGPAVEDLVTASHSSHDPGWTETADDAGIECAEASDAAPFEPGFQAALLSRAPGAIDVTNEPEENVDEPQVRVAAPARVIEAAPAGPDLLAVAHLCTELGRVENADDVPPLLEEAARLLEATGLIVWLWDESVEGLRPALAHGYSDNVLAHLPTVRRDADNATAGAFRSAQTCAIGGSGQASGALVVPLMTSAGCAGVLAIELEPPTEPTEAVHAVAMIFAALLAQLVNTRAEDVSEPPEMTVPQLEEFTPPVLHTHQRR